LSHFPFTPSARSENPQLEKTVKITTHLINKIQIALKAKKMNQSQLAAKIGYHRSHISKLLKGEVVRLTPDLIDKLNDALTLDLNPMDWQQSAISPTAMELSKIAETDPGMGRIMEELVNLARPKISAFMPHVDTKKLPKLGAEITRIRNENPLPCERKMNGLRLFSGYRMMQKAHFVGTFRNVLIV
jgi:transcriptional regulator with XRE-family HTH domain